MSLAAAPMAPTHVLRVSDRFEVPRVDAISHPTQMIDLQPFGNGADVEFVGVSVRSPASTVDTDLRVVLLALVAPDIDALISWADCSDLLSKRHVTTPRQGRLAPGSQESHRHQ